MVILLFVIFTSFACLPSICVYYYRFHLIMAVDPLVCVPITNSNAFRWYLYHPQMSYCKSLSYEWMLFFYCVFYRAVNAIILVDPSADVGTGTEGCWLMAIWLSHTGTSVAKPRFFLRTLGRNSSHRRTRNKWTEQTNIRSKEIVYTECNNQCF